MTTFAYKARDLNGLLVAGEMEGLTSETIFDSLGEQGLIPIHVFKGSQSFSQGLSLDFLKQVTNEELMLFTRQFHTLFKAGMDMETLLSTLAKQTKNKFFSDALVRIKSDIASGSSLARSFSQHPKIFNELYTNMLATGEEGGVLDEVLGQVSILLEKETTLKSSVKSATLYPKIVMFVLLCACVAMLTMVIPKFAEFYAHYKAELPIPTKLLLGISHVATHYWHICILVTVPLVVLFKKWVATVKGRLSMDKFKWSLPVFGPLGQKVANARFANILGILYKAGLPITRGLEITSKTIDHAAFSRDILFVKGEVEKGRSIAEAMRATHYFSPLLVEATAIGEKSGAIDDMYQSVGSHYDMEVNHTLKNLTTLLEPILLFVVFGMVTLFALAIFLPMWGLSSVVGH